MKVGSQLSGWEGFYADRAERRDAATDPALREHFDNELQQARITMQAMGIEVPQDSARKSETPGSTNAHAETDPGPKPGNDVKFVDKDGAPVSNALDKATQSGSLSAGLNESLQPYRQDILAASDATGVPANLLAAVIWDESKGVASAGTINGENGQTDSGLMQINSETFAALKAQHPDLVTGEASDPKNNIMAGALYLKEQYDQFGDWDLALRAYNSGPLSVDPSDHTISTTGFGTKNYVEKVNFYEDLLNQGSSMPDGYPAGNETY
ncbi:transglycosylase SLT domain-containing protein [Brucella sp. BE17]|uniref:transglycosylase SLT domain-containing protein n=1 Tax=Brucella sp. BE17 TaxID=3142977 RepID=UPI0031BAEE62